MTDNSRSDASQDSKAGQTDESAARETLGEMLRRNREMRKIPIETVARDLKLNASYIKALEAGNCDQLPADPYVRVYLRALAGHLMLDTEEVLLKYCEERGIKPSQYKEDRSTQITITMKKPEAKRTPWMTIGAVAAALIILSLIANKAGWIYSSSGRVSETSGAQTPAETGSLLADTSLVDSIAAVQAVLSQGDSAPADTSNKSHLSKDTVLATAVITGKDAMKLELGAVKDSVWFQVFSDGVSWRNFIYRSKSRVFTACDSFNVHAGSATLAKVKLNGKDIKLEGKGVTFIRIDKSGTQTWDQARWNKVFGKRLD
jgi:cytoskeletal protein RodZ